MCWVIEGVGGDRGQVVFSDYVNPVLIRGIESIRSNNSMPFQSIWVKCMVLLNA